MFGRRSRVASAAHRVDRAALYYPLREIEVYGGILAGRKLRTARCYGAVVDPASGRF